PGRRLIPAWDDLSGPGTTSDRLGEPDNPCPPSSGINRRTHDRFAPNMADPPTRGLARDLCHIALVDPDRWEDPPGSKPLDESWLALHALRDSQRPDHITRSAREPHLSDRFRLHRPSAHGPDERWPHRRCCARTAGSGNFLQAPDGRDGQT